MYLRFTLPGAVFFLLFLLWQQLRMENPWTLVGGRWGGWGGEQESGAGDVAVAAAAVAAAAANGAGLGGTATANGERIDCSLVLLFHFFLECRVAIACGGRCCAPRQLLRRMPSAAAYVLVGFESNSDVILLVLHSFFFYARMLMLWGGISSSPRVVASCRTTAGPASWGVYLLRGLLLTILARLARGFCP